MCRTNYKWDNIIGQQKLNILKNKYNEIKTLLNNMLEKMEQDQQMQLDNLKYTLYQGGRLKMSVRKKMIMVGMIMNLKLAE